MNRQMRMRTGKGKLSVTLSLMNANRGPERKIVEPVTEENEYLRALTLGNNFVTF